MKSSTTVVLIVASATLLACLAIVNAAPSKNTDLSITALRSKFEEFKQKHERVYESVEEEAMRFEIFVKNYIEVERFNAEESESAGYTLGINHLSDRTPEELQKMHGLILPKDDE